MDLDFVYQLEIFYFYRLTYHLLFILIQRTKPASNDWSLLWSFYNL